jgi:hypothetical protein
VAFKLLTLVNSTLDAKVDSDDWSTVSGYRWLLHKGIPKRGKAAFTYAITYWYTNGKRSHMMLHNLIMGFKGVDHINGNGLDCRKSNLRAATKSQNAANSKPHRDSKSKAKGVWWSVRDNCWYAQICCQGKKYSLGVHNTKEAAIESYNLAASKLFGDFSRQSIIKA